MACTKKITNFDKEKSLVLDHDALQGILSKLKQANRPFAIISIAGQMRTGKSFLLNFLLRCLRNGGPGNPNWIGDGETSARDGPVWRSGPEPETKGIHIWDEIFTLTRQNGKEISVLLMDTQGLFDHDTVPGNNEKLFTLSTLASSVQILNVSRQINERDLEYLQLCVEYAEAKQDKPHYKLQHLFMLVRDWPYDEMYPYGLKGGNAYFQSILAKREKNGQHVQHLETNFEGLECFAMPYPGATVNRNQNFDGKNSELDKKFLEQVEIFTNHFLDPDKLALKTMSERELANFLIACDNLFVSGEVPRIADILEASLNGFWASRYEDSIENFHNGLSPNNNSDPPKSVDALQNMYSRNTIAALQKFDRYPTPPSPNRKKYRKHLEEICVWYYGLLKEQNDVQMENTQHVIEAGLIGSIQQYKENMNKDCGVLSLDISKLVSHHHESYAAARSNFEELTSEYADYATKGARTLLREADKLYCMRRKDNERKVKEEKLAKMKEMFEPYQVKERLLTEYANEVNKELSAIFETGEDLNEYLDTKFQKTVNLFDEQMQEESDYAKTHRKEFKKKLKSLHQEFKQHSERIKAHVLRKQAIKCRQEVVQFKLRILQKLQFSLVDPVHLGLSCDNFFEKNMEQFQEELEEFSSNKELKSMVSTLEKYYKTANEKFLPHREKNKKYSNLPVVQYRMDNILVDVQRTMAAASSAFAVNPIAGGMTLVSGGLAICGKLIYSKIKN